MNNTGIVRRIDDLGRVVIPKELRRILRLKEGDPVEMWVDGSQLMMKKYSAVHTMEELASSYAKSLSECTAGFRVLITDMENVVAASGMSRAVDTEIGDEIKFFLSMHAPDMTHHYTNSLLQRESRDVSLYGKGHQNVQGFLMHRIVVSGDVVGTVVLINPSPERAMGDAERMALKTAATFLGKALEL
jgi:AbrB family transcriptional regulator (stage V sporulation protein T)